MKSVQETTLLILDYFDTLPAQKISTREAYGRVLREDIRALRDHPAYPTATMDGFAVRSSDFHSGNAGTTLEVIGRVSAGVFPTINLEAGQAVEIMTGALIPETADAVVAIEATDWYGSNDHHPNQVNVRESASSGDNIRSAGRDYRTGEIILQNGRLLGPRELAMISMLGIPEVQVSQKPKIGILASGDELLQEGEEWTPGKIYNSNSALLDLSINENHAAAFDLGIAEDSRESVLEKFILGEKLGLDLIVTSAGVSVSDRDFIRIVLEEHGEIYHWKVNLKPGKPLLFGEYKAIKVIGLPGNPVSTYVGFKKFVVPVIQKLLGMVRFDRNFFQAQLGEDIDSDGRETYIRGRLSSQDGCMIASSVEHQDSGNLKGLVNSDILIKIPAGVRRLKAGSEVEIEIIY